MPDAGDAACPRAWPWGGHSLTSRRDRKRKERTGITWQQVASGGGDHLGERGGKFEKRTIPFLTAGEKSGVQMGPGYLRYELRGEVFRVGFNRRGFEDHLSPSSISTKKRRKLNRRF